MTWAPPTPRAHLYLSDLTSNFAHFASSTTVTGLFASSPKHKHAPSCLCPRCSIYLERPPCILHNSPSLLPLGSGSNDNLSVRPTNSAYLTKHYNPLVPIISYPPYPALILFLFLCSILTHCVVSLFIISIVIALPPTVSSMRVEIYCFCLYCSVLSL